ncbi:hypothetical protein [Geomonas agri]|uniref:hypothetical protein n=1 Tax=Geomonas agri TaxID=2873702 RepID=UPI001CD6F9E9|nr:hypothetical protein [Geomonas agri]
MDTIENKKVRCRVYLSRRNLLTLLQKLDRKVAGQQTKCTIIKRDNAHPVFPQTMVAIAVTAVEDEEYYSHRAPGPVCIADTPGRELALAILKLKGHEYLDAREYAVVEEFLSKYRS